MDSCEAAELGSADEKSFSSSCSGDSESQVVLFGALLGMHHTCTIRCLTKHDQTLRNWLLVRADMTCLTTIKTTSNLFRYLRWIKMVCQLHVPFLRNTGLVKAFNRSPLLLSQQPIHQVHRRLDKTQARIRGGRRTMVISTWDS